MGEIGVIEYSKLYCTNQRTTTAALITAAADYPSGEGAIFDLTARYRYCTVDGNDGACRVWIRTGNGTYKLAQHGVSLELCCAGRIELFPDASDPEPYVRLHFSDGPLVWWPINRQKPNQGTYADVDTASLVHAGLSSAKAGTFVDSTIPQGYPWVTLDGSSGATKAWVNDGESTQLLEHGRPTLTRLDASTYTYLRIAPHYADRTSVVRILYSRHPIELPPIKRRVIQKSLATSSGVSNNCLVWEHVEPRAPLTDTFFIYASGAIGAGALLLDRIDDPGTAATTTNSVASSLVATTHVAWTPGTYHDLRALSIRHTQASVTLYVCIREMLST